MKTFLTLILLSSSSLLYCGTVVAAQSETKRSSLTVSGIDYSDAELEQFGFTRNDLKNYSKRLNSIEGKWWGHLSPMEMMMYSAKTEVERRRFAKMYLTTNNPKAQAERKSAIAMYSIAREIIANELEGTLSQANSRNIILFVNVDCADCAGEVKSLVSEAAQKVDIYVTNLNAKLNIKNQLVNWARALDLPHQKVTLNDDKGIYLKSYGQTLDRLKVIQE